MYTKLVLTVFFVTCVVFVQNQEEFVSQVLSTRKNINVNWFTYLGKTYYVDSVFKVNFYKAMQYCRQQGMHLVSITSEAENKKIEQFIKDKGYTNYRYWTSATNLADRPNQWIWLSTGRDITYFKWDTGEPNNTRIENCIEGAWFTPAGFTWNDVTCLRSNNFICESTTDCYNLKC